MSPPRIIALALAIAAASSLAEPAKPAKSEPSAQDLRRKAARQHPHDLCVALGRQIRNPATTRAGEAWEEAVAAVAAAYGVVPQDQGYIRERRLRIGMHWCAVLAAMGLPSYSNRTVSPWGVSIQLVYERPRRYVYLENDHVHAWQD